MFEKRAKYTITLSDVQQLNTPNIQMFKESSIDLNSVNETIQKIASSQKESSEKSGDGSEAPVFDLESEIDSHPDSLFIKCFAIKADETNDNGDFFSREELIKATPTFTGVPLFTNHANSDINEARGKVVHSWWDDDRNGIMIVGRVDAAAYPQLARGIKEEYVLGTSMGCVTPKCRVLMSDSTHLPISEVQPGDKVYTHRGRVREVLNTQVRTKKEFIKHINFENSSSALEITKNHPVLTLKEKSDSKNFNSDDLVWKDSQDLTDTDSVMLPLECNCLCDLDKQKIVDVYTSDPNEQKENKENVYTDYDKYMLRKIKNIDAVFYDGPVYNLQVKEDNSYICEDTIVKNCQVQYSLCSICHNYAETPDQYCSCIQERKTRQVNARSQECKYHEQGGEKKCPICGSTKNSTKKFSVNSKVFEYNYGIKFIENSFVVNPACVDCGITEVIDPSKFIAKVANVKSLCVNLNKSFDEFKSDTKRIKVASNNFILYDELQNTIQHLVETLPSLIKEATEKDIICTDQKCIKLAGQQELDSLSQALDLCSSVSKAMLDQKEQIDLEFLSDLVAVVADLQGVIDELTEQGYGRLQSPEQAPEGTNPLDSVEAQPSAGIPQESVTHSVNPPPASQTGGKIQSGPAGQAGTVTGPLAKNKIINLKKLSSVIAKKQKRKLDLNFACNKENSSMQKFASKKSFKKINLPFHIRKSK